MKRKWKVWLVDDLPSNLRKFKSNHESHYAIRTFKHPKQVMEQIAQENYPDALLCDVFFYDEVREAKRVEGEIEKLSKALKRAAKKSNANDHSRTLGINLMEDIFEHFNYQRPPFPMYAYTSKGPFLLERKEWKKLSKYRCRDTFEAIAFRRKTSGTKLTVTFRSESKMPEEFL